VVQPHEAWTDLKWTNVLPTFSYLKCATACLSLKPGRRSTDVCSHFSSACALWTSAAKAKTPINLEKFVFIFLETWALIYSATASRQCRGSTPARAANFDVD